MCGELTQISEKKRSNSLEINFVSMLETNQLIKTKQNHDHFETYLLVLYLSIFIWWCNLTQKFKSIDSTSYFDTILNIILNHP